jgi:hypothetical protein
MLLVINNTKQALPKKNYTKYFSHLFSCSLYKYREICNMSDDASIKSYLDFESYFIMEFVSLNLRVFLLISNLCIALS